MKTDDRPRRGFDAVFIAPHAHFDLSWLGTPRECEDVNNAVIAAALDLLDAHDDYRYSIETVRPLERFLVSRPGEKDRIRRLFSQGRLEIGGAYVDLASDYSFDEALARNVSIGQLYLRRALGFASDIVREEDVTCHFAQLPQLLAESGVRFFKISRGRASAFRWYAPDGSHVAAALFEYSHSFHFRLGADPALTLKNLSPYLRWMRTQVSLPLRALLIMDGDDCTPPNPNLPAVVKTWNETAGDPPVRLSTVRDFMKSLPLEHLPALRGDMPGLWGGVMLFELDAARAFHLAETLLPAAEKFDAIRSLVSDSPPAEHDRSWRILLAAQDHNWGGKDPSKHGEQADRDKVAMIESVVERSHATLHDALHRLSAAVRPARDGVPLVVFNPLSWERTDVIAVRLPPEMPAANLDVLTASGETVPSQPAHAGHPPGGALSFIAENVPPFGWKTYYLVHVKNPAHPPRVESGALSRLENDFYRLELSPRGIRRIFDKRLSADVAGFNPHPLLKMTGFGIPFLALVGAGARLTTPPPEFFLNPENIKKGGSGERVRFLWKLWTRFTTTGSELLEGAVSRRLRLHGVFLGCRVVHEIVLYHKIKRIDFTTEISWKGTPGVFIAMLFPLPFRKKEIHVGTPFFVHRIGDEAEGAWKMPGYRLHPKIRGVHNWFCVGGADRSVTISSPWRVWDFTLLPAALLMASDDRGGFFTGDYYLQKGARSWRFSLTSHRGGWKQAMSWRRGVEPVHPLIPFLREEKNAPLPPSRRGAPRETAAAPLPAEASFCEVSPDGVVATALKRPESGDASLFVRLCEMLGAETDVTLRFPCDVRKATRATLLEDDVEELKARGATVTLKTRPYEIANVKIFFGGKPAWTT
ncbi:MAG: glycosyl hydrolase-related protein [bacterium]